MKDLDFKGQTNLNFYKELIQKAGAETELVYMKASKELLQKRLYKRNQVLNANSPFVITDEILEHHYHAFQEPWGEGEKVILQKEDIMQYSKEESKAIWNQNAEFWDCAMGDEFSICSISAILEYPSHWGLFSLHRIINTQGVLYSFLSVSICSSIWGLSVMRICRLRVFGIISSLVFLKLRQSTMP